MTAADLLAFINASPTPYHAATEIARRLRARGYEPALDDLQAGSSAEHPQIPPRGYFLRGGMLLAWHRPQVGPDAPFRIIGAHTDSPNLRIEPQPDLDGSGCRRLAAEPYGGVLLNSWLDRDLGLAGRVGVREADGSIGERLFRDDRPVLRVPQLAIHLDREVNDKGLVLNRQLHLNPVWGLGTGRPGEFREWVAEAVGVAAGDVLAWDAMCHVAEPGRLIGTAEDLLSAPRLDNLCSCYGAFAALEQADDGDQHISLIALFDHEEVGSESSTGALSPWLGRIIELLRGPEPASAQAAARSTAASRCLSADMAHGVHPNYPDRHEPNHRVTLGGGPVVKSNLNQRYATEALTSAEFVDACERVGVPVQQYAHRSDLPCGSTIGPITAARLGIATVDVGMAQLSMHSSRELMAADDVELMERSFGAWLSNRT